MLKGERSGAVWRLAGVGCLALALAATPASAFAAKPKAKPKKLGSVVTQAATAVSPISTPTMDAHVTATATCPAGMKAVGGGWASSETNFPPPINLQVFLVVNTSVMSGQQSWTNTATGRNNYFVMSQPGSVTLTLTTIVYCRKLKATILDVAATAPTTGAGSAVATCPKRQQLISGGFSTDTTTNTPPRPSASFRSGKRAWTYQTGGSTANAAAPLIAHAYCTKGIQAPKEVTTSAAPIVVGQEGRPTVASPPCGGKTPRLSAGGFMTQRASLGSEQTVVQNLINGSTWQTITRFGLGAQGTQQAAPLTVQGICLQR